MDTKMGPSYANLFVGLLKNLFSNNTPALNLNFLDATLMIVLVLHLAANLTLNLLFFMLILFTHHLILLGKSVNFRHFSWHLG